MKKILITLLLTLSLLMICSCHKWTPATCELPQTCSDCGKTSGDPLGHKWIDATCTEPKTCSVCGKTIGEPLGHDATKATCTEPSVCRICEEEIKPALGHHFTNPSCTESGKCTRCGLEGEKAIGHDFAEATCESPSKCRNCSETIGEALGHDIQNNKCTRCGKFFPTTMTIDQFDDLLSKQELAVISTNYLVQDTRYKSLYPDLLSATIKNNSDYDIKNAVVAYVAWDNNNLPVKIDTDSVLSDPKYVVSCNWNDINLIPNSTYGNGKGLGLDRNCNNIAKFKAIVVNFETFDGVKWENPYFEDWKEFYSGVKYSDDSTIDVYVIE